MKMRWAKFKKTEFVPENTAAWGYTGLFKKQVRIERKLQYWDTDILDWMDVNEVEINLDKEESS
jgi:hypothetical protein